MTGAQSPTLPGHPVVRIVDPPAAPTGPARLVVSGVRDLEALRSAWAPSGANITQVGGRLHALSTVSALVRAAGRGLPEGVARALVAAAKGALAASQAPGTAWRTATRPLSLERTAVMGVLNVTPDSFSDGGRLYPDDHPRAAVEHARRLVTEGAVVVDVGGESTRPGSQTVSVDEEVRRVLPVVERLVAEGVTVSIDTTKAAVAQAALRAGAGIVNDVSGGRDLALLAAAAESGAGYVLMHSRSTPAEMQHHTDYDDIVAEVYEYLEQGVRRCAAAGMSLGQIAIDPGIGFAKTADQNLQLLAALEQFRGIGRPVLLGVSRKSFIGSVLGADDPADRLEGSLACAALACRAGVAVLRVHDVAATVRVARMTEAVMRAGTGPPGATGPGP